MHVVWNNPNATGRVPATSFGPFLASVSAEMAARVIDAISRVASRTPSPAKVVDPEFYVAPTLLDDFLKDGARSLASRLKNPSRLLELYLEILGNDALVYPRLRLACYERIADNPATLAKRQDCVVGTLQLRPGDAPPDAFHNLMDEDFAKRLRPLLFEPPVGVGGYNVGVLELLAEYGDEETARRFREWASNQGYLEETIDAVGGPVWKIEAQHEPRMLLEHLRSTEWVSHQTRLWALERLVRCGVGREEIRAALIEHAEKIGDDKRLAFDLGHLKLLATERGVLGPKDLAEVPTPAVRNGKGRD